MSTILILISILFFFKLLRDGLFFVWLWQVKEYRMDRMISHLKENGGMFKNNLFYIIALCLIAFSYAIPYNFLLIYSYAALLFFIFTAFQILMEIKKRSLMRPKFTLKIIIIFFISIFFYVSLLASMLMLSQYFWLYNNFNAEFINSYSAIAIRNILLFCIALPFVISSAVIFANPFLNFQKRRLIKRAAEKMRGLKKIKVIGITGSYGKTSAKEFLYAMLSQKYKVVKTEGNNNTNIGVAYTVLNKVSDDYDYFICEMGAYKIGEIKEMCEIVKPEIGILTGINNQHIDLFGSQKNIIKAKFELIEELPENGLAVINESIKYQVSSIKAKNLKYFSLGDARNIKVYQNYVEFEHLINKNCHPELVSGSVSDLSLANFNSPKSRSNCIGERGGNNRKILKQVQNDKNNNLIKFKFNILGKHYIENLLSAIITAEHLGVSLEEIKNAAEKIKPTKYMMRKIEGLNNSIFIDDSYSANFNGVMAALDYLEEAYSDYKKIIVFPGIIELGKESEEVHKMLYDRISKVCEIAYIINIPNSKFSVRGGLALGWQIPNSKFVFEKDFGKVAEMLKNELGKNTVALFESRGAGAVMGKLKMEKSK